MLYTTLFVGQLNSSQCDFWQQNTFLIHIIKIYLMDPKKDYKGKDCLCNGESQQISPKRSNSSAPVLGGNDMMR